MCEEASILLKKQWINISAVHFRTTTSSSHRFLRMLSVASQLTPQKKSALRLLRIHLYVRSRYQPINRKRRKSVLASVEILMPLGRISASDGKEGRKAKNMVGSENNRQCESENGATIASLRACGLAFCGYSNISPIYAKIHNSTQLSSRAFLISWVRNDNK